MTMRSVARVCAAGLLAAGALTFAATPALAADVDFGVDIKGTTLALGANAKPATITVSNNGSTKPSEVKIKFDASKVNLGDKAVVDLGDDGEDDCALDGQGRAECVLDDSIVPAPGGSVDLAVFIRKVAAGTGKAGKLTVSVEVDGDSNKKNDSDTVDVTLAEDKGVDLTAFAEDVTLHDVDEGYTGKPIPAGGKSVAEAFVVNFGDQTSAGLTAAATLPKGATFVAQQAEGCDFSADQRSVRCNLTAGQLSLAPGTVAAFQFDIEVAQDVKGPVSLKDGSWTFVAREVVEPRAARKVAPQALPDYVFKVDPVEINHMDIDPSDNIDGFAVLVAGPAGGSGGGTGGDGGDDPDLPVTGPVAGTVAGLGGAVLVAGAVMFVMSRRRRVILVTPGDEK
jgi:hypothetical protein